MLVAGIDVGAVSAQAVIMSDGQIAAQTTLVTGEESAIAARLVLDEALRLAGVSQSDLGSIVATGIGKASVDVATRSKSEVVCLGKGTAWLYPEARTVIDIGAESSKVLRLNDLGGVEDFANNDKCASGTGVFLEAAAKILEVSLDQLGVLSLAATGKASISGMCAVFAESEIVSHVHTDIPKSEIIAGVHSAIADRVSAVVNRVGPQPAVVMCGGVARNVGMVKALEEKIGFSLLVPENPEMVAALGAALIARDTLAKGKS
ncbi:MAG: acyl-CoA dehydratase activase [Dehalococcoidia bacterium]|nr:acyl-CoA dehydratase activase [Dehalococcoidia bacterium]